MRLRCAAPARSQGGQEHAESEGHGSNKEPSPGHGVTLTAPHTGGQAEGCPLRAGGQPPALASTVPQENPAFRHRSPDTGQRRRNRSWKTCRRDRRCGVPTRPRALAEAAGAGARARCDVLVTSRQPQAGSRLLNSPDGVPVPARVGTGPPLPVPAGLQVPSRKRPHRFSLGTVFFSLIFRNPP